MRRDIEALLNARIQWHTWPTQYKELATSCLSYGLPDFSSMSASSRRAHFMRNSKKYNFKNLSHDF
ncbi:hypothetical protein ACOBV9_18410 (plasmid) [Pseudoalteromonas espejiana]